MNTSKFNRKLDQSPTLWQVFQSVLAAIFGVQKNANRERDFQHGKPWQYIVMGIVVVLFILLGIYGLVGVVLSGAGS